jgi:hypothetical protein
VKEKTARKTEFVLIEDGLIRILTYSHEPRFAEKYHKLFFT